MEGRTPVVATVIAAASGLFLLPLGVIESAATQIGLSGILHLAPGSIGWGIRTAAGLLASILFALLVWGPVADARSAAPWAHSEKMVVREDDVAPRRLPRSPDPVGTADLGRIQTLLHDAQSATAVHPGMADDVRPLPRLVERFERGAARWVGSDGPDGTDRLDRLIALTRSPDVPGEEASMTLDVRPVATLDAALAHLRRLSSRGGER